MADRDITKGIWRIDQGVKTLVAEINKIDTINGLTGDAQKALTLVAGNIGWFETSEIESFRSELANLEADKPLLDEFDSEDEYADAVTAWEAKISFLEFKIGSSIRSWVDRLANKIGELGAGLDGLNGVVGDSLTNITNELTATNISLDTANLVLFGRFGSRGDRPIPNDFATEWTAFEASNPTPTIGTPYPGTLIDIVARMANVVTIDKFMINTGMPGSPRTVIGALDVVVDDKENDITIRQFVTNVGNGEVTPIPIKITGEGAVEITYEGNPQAPDSIGIGVDLSGLVDEAELPPIVTAVAFDAGTPNEVTVSVNTHDMSLIGDSSDVDFTFKTEGGITATPTNSGVILSVDANKIEFTNGTNIGDTLINLLEKLSIDDKDPLLGFDENGALSSLIDIEVNNGTLRLTGANGFYREVSIALGSSIVFAGSAVWNGAFTLPDASTEVVNDINSSAAQAGLKIGHHYLIIVFKDATGTLQPTFTDLDEIIQVYTAGDGIEIDDNEISLQMYPVAPRAAKVEVIANKGLRFNPGFVTETEFENISAESDNDGLYIVG
jgi:hypothetical protein